MSNHIGIVMGGYLDENDKLMDREELNRRIAAIQKENEKLKGKVSELSWDGALNEAQDKINTLKRKLDLAVEALKLYGKEKNWYDKSIFILRMSLFDVPKWLLIKGKCEPDEEAGGKIARLALKEIGEKNDRPRD